MSVDPDIPLYLFARSPVPGQVKTRMQPQLTASRAAALASLMLVHSVRKINAHWPGSLVLTVTPDQNHACFEDLRNRYRMDLEIQVEGNLGQKMAHVLEKSIRQCGSGIVMGCDVPHISGNILLQVHTQMSRRKNIIGPTLDGGFYILGLHEFNHDIFDQVEWGLDQVLSKTLENLQTLGMDIEFSRKLRDIDDWSDLCWLADEDPDYRQFVDNPGDNSVPGANH